MSNPLNDAFRAEYDAPAPAVAIVSGANISPVPVRWIWEGYLARGKLHILAGAPGGGKTTLALALAATVTAGGRWPDGTISEIGNVLIWSGEDDRADTLIPRLLVMGANSARIFFVGDVFADGKHRPFDPSRDMASIEAEAERIGDIRLIILDPVSNAIAGDSHKNAEARRGLAPVVNLAQRLDAAALGISHFSKGTGGRDPVERVTGSVAFGALPRIVFAAAKKVDESGQVERFFVRAKSNIGPDGGGFRFDLSQVQLDGHTEISASCVSWVGAIAGAARDLLAEAEASDDPAEKGATAEAQDWLRSLLAYGPLRAPDVQREARQAGISDRALRRARERLGVTPRKRGFGKSGGWEWEMPSAKGAPDANHEKQGVLSILGTLANPKVPHQHTKNDIGAPSGSETLVSALACQVCDGQGCSHCEAT